MAFLSCVHFLTGSHYKLRPNTEGSEENVATSMDGMIQSATLLKNIGKTLPLSSATAGKIAVIGPNGQLSQADASYYGPSNVCGLKFWTVVDAMSKYAKENATFVRGIPSVLSRNQSGIAAAVSACAAADTCVVAIGSDLTWGAEGHDATNISYTVAQQKLVTQAAAASCAFFDRNVHSRMTLVPTPARLKLLCVCDQWHSSESYRVLTPLTGWYRKLRPNAAGRAHHSDNISQ
jgi:hypothetical protein